MEENNSTNNSEAETNKEEFNVPEIKLQFHKGQVFGKITKSSDAADLIRSLFPEGAIELQEYGFALYLNRTNEVIGYYRHSVGGVTATIFDTKLILSTGVKSLCSRIILAHNHPSGNLQPSEQDKQLTKRLKQAANLLEIDLTDHIIVTKEGYYSLADEGQLWGLDGHSETAPDILIANDKTEKNKEPDEAREYAKQMLRRFIARGETVQTLRNTKRDFYHDFSLARINGNKVQVTMLDNVKVDYSFPLQSIYNEVADEMKKAPKPVAVKPEPLKPKPISKKTETEEEDEQEEHEPTQVEHITEEVRFIKKYAVMEGKLKTEKQLMSLLNSLKRAIIERRIRKVSPFKEEIEFMQNCLVNVVNNMRKIKDPEKRVVKVEIKPEMLKRLLAVGKSEKVRLSVNYLKRFVNIQGTRFTKEKAERLLKAIKFASQKRKVTRNDPYATSLQNIYQSVFQFLKVAKPKDTIEINEEVLNGINNALEGCDCEKKKTGAMQPNHSPLKGTHKNTVMNSMDFANLKFDSLGFTGKWLELVGDPAEGFTAMVYGKPKVGKSYLCVDWAGYLARNHGDTLYVAREEKLDATLQKKLNDKNVKHRCLFVSDHLPGDLTPYQFVFLDSVNKLGLTPQDLENLKIEYPGKSFIDVHQTTKDGNFRGTNEYQHDVDVVIEVPERGKAVQFGRFNQGGQMNIFDNYGEGFCQKGDQLNGTKKKYDVISPDGFSIRGTPFSTEKARRKYFEEWKAGFRRQGYYSSVPYGRIPLEDLEDYCQWIEI